MILFLLLRYFRLLQHTRIHAVLRLLFISLDSLGFSIDCLAANEWISFFLNKHSQSANVCHDRTARLRYNSAYRIYTIFLNGKNILLKFLRLASRSWSPPKSNQLRQVTQPIPIPPKISSSLLFVANFLSYFAEKYKDKKTTSFADVVIIQIFVRCAVSALKLNLSRRRSSGGRQWQMVSDAWVETPTFPWGFKIP